MKTFIEVLKVIGAGLGFLFLTCLPGLIEWACRPIPTWLLAIIVVAMWLGGCGYVVWLAFFKEEE